MVSLSSPTNIFCCVYKVPFVYKGFPLMRACFPRDSGPADYSTPVVRSSMPPPLHLRSNPYRSRQFTPPHSQNLTLSSQGLNSSSPFRRNETKYGSPPSLNARGMIRVFWITIAGASLPYVNAAFGLSVDRII